jgi:hypothetical protein
MRGFFGCRGYAEVTLRLLACAACGELVLRNELVLQAAEVSVLG